MSNRKQTRNGSPGKKNGGQSSGSDSFVNISDSSATIETLSIHCKSVDDCIESGLKNCNRVQIEIRKCKQCQAITNILEEIKSELTGMRRQCGFPGTNPAPQCGSTVANPATQSNFPPNGSPLRIVNTDVTNKELQERGLLNDQELLAMKKEIAILKEKIYDKDLAIERLQNELKQRMEELQEKREYAEHLAAQVYTYKEDFETERGDRERAQGQLSDLQQQYNKIQQQLELCKQRIVSMTAIDHGSPRRGRQDLTPRHFDARPGDVEIDGDSNGQAGEYVRMLPRSELTARGVYQSDSGYPTTPSYWEASHPKAPSHWEASQPKAPSKWGTDSEDRVYSCITEVADSNKPEEISVGLDEDDGLPAPRGRINYKPTSSKTTPIHVNLPFDYHRDSASNRFENPDILDSYDLGLELDGCQRLPKQTVNHCATQDSLYCPYCSASFSMDQHIQLLDHMENVCMQ